MADDDDDFEFELKEIRRVPSTISDGTVSEMKA